MGKRKSYKISEAQLNLFDLSHPVMPVLDVSRCEARLINHETAARMVETYHYAHRVPSISFAMGLFIDNALAGCICYGTPAATNQRELCGKEYIERMLELNRLFIFDWAGKNSESWLIGQSFKYLSDSQYVVLLSYADTSRGHLGKIYQATNWLYTGLSDPGGAREIIINGKSVHSHTVADLYGTRSLKQLSSMGVDFEVSEKILKHRYVYFLGNKRQRKELRKALKWPVLPYPKNVASLPTNGQ